MSLRFLYSMSIIVKKVMVRRIVKIKIHLDSSEKNTIGSKNSTDNKAKMEKHM